MILKIKSLKYQVGIFFIIWCAVSFILGNAERVCAQNTIHLTNGEWPPYMSKNLKHYGVVSRIVSEAFSYKGVNVQYAFFPWQRSYQLAKAGKQDGSVVWFHSDERERDFYFSQPVVNVKYVFFHLKTFDFKWNDIADLSGITIGATKEYQYGDAFEKAEKEKKITVLRVPQDEMNLKKLLRGRIQIFPLDIDVGYNLMNKIFTPEEMSKITYHPKPIRVDPLHLILSRKKTSSQKFLPLFNEGLSHLQNSGAYEKYFQESRRGEYVVK